MKLGISSYAYGWAIGFGDAQPERPMTAFDLLESGVKFQAEVLQIADNLAPEKWPIDQQSEIATRAAQQGIALELGARHLTPKRIEALSDVAVEMGASLVRFLIDGEQYHPDLAEVTTVLQSAARSLPKNLKIAIENHDRFSASELQELMENVASEQIGICLDVANSFGTGEGVETVMRRLRPWVLNLHVKDISIRRIDTLMGFLIEGCPAGQGKIDIPWILRQVTPRCESTILESWTPKQNSLAETVAVESDWVEQSYSYVKTLFDERLDDA